MAHVDLPHLESLQQAVQRLAPVIRAYADETEQNRRLAPPVVAAIAEAGLFRMMTPQALGGFEAHPLTFYHIVEEVARLDGSTGWCLFIAGCNPLMGAFLPDHTAAEVFGRDPHVAVAGVVLPYGRAVAQDGGYVVHGHWSYGSGCQHCAWIFCMCQVWDGERQRLTASGEPEVRALFLRTAQVRILDTWDVSGLAGTGSHDVVIDNVFVPEAYTCAFGLGMTPCSTYYQGLLYRYPLYGVFALPISAVALGIAQGAVDACLELAQTGRPSGNPARLGERALFHLRLAEAVALVRSARAWLHAAVQQAWEALQTHGEVYMEARADLLLAAANATRSAAAAVDSLYTIAGASANYRRSPLQRALRDVHAATQHMGTALPQFESAGRMLVGLPPLQPHILL
ncbi:MAG: hydroxylase [Candidatus Tectomicrobia bacterium]|uniref:Hydroxylase n=1 Tax=Tectimicrobiota bacterium TaxID=2528274 RepID=A0A938B2L0_UNCTE|nr:hydroxylase [Candidatus Tectomicrobia bacterium]